MQDGDNQKRQQQHDYTSLHARMTALKFPPNAIEVLEREGPDSSTCDVPWSKWLIYNIETAPKEAEELYVAAMESHINPSPKSEWDTQSFLKPAEQTVALPDVQHVLDHHIRMLEGMHDELENTGRWDWQVYTLGFIVITNADWRETGVTAVHCDIERKKWKVLQCKNIPLGRLWKLQSIVFGDCTFDDVSRDCDASGNDGPDNQGGPVPEGEWQFAVYCTAPSGNSALQWEAECNVPDPRNEFSMGEGEECLCFLNQDLPSEKANEDWPLAYANLIRNPSVYPSPCKRHPSLFVHIRDDLDNIEIVKMDWDHDIERSDEELKKIGRESTTSVQMCDADSLVSTLEQLAQDT